MDSVHRLSRGQHSFVILPRELTDIEVAPADLGRHQIHHPHYSVRRLLVHHRPSRADPVRLQHRRLNRCQRRLLDRHQL
jgi:hypothetical protein